MVLHGLADVGEVPFHRRADVHLPEVCAQLRRQQLRVGAGAACGAEAGHGNGQNALAVPAQQIKRLGGDEDGKGGIQPAAQPHHGAGGVGVLQTLFQAQGGDFEDFLAPLRPAGFVRRDKGGGRNGAGEGGVHRLQRKIVGINVPAGGGKSIYPAAFIGQPFYIQFTHRQAGMELVFCQ